MALHLNLYHEIQKQKSQSRRDPLKLGMYGLGVVALCLAGYYFLRLREASEVMGRLDRMQAEWEKMEPLKNAAEARAADLSKSIQTSDALVKTIENRFYWAPLLGQLLEATPKNVQITKFDGQSQNDKVATCTFAIAGLSSGAEPRRVAEELRTALHNKFAENHSKVTAVFQTLEDAPETVVMDGASMPVANFGIKLDMAQQEEKQMADNTPAKKAKDAMKLNAEESKKVILSGLLMSALLYCYFSLLLGPLAAREVAAEKAMKALQPQIAAAKLQIKQTQAIEARAPVAGETLEQIKAMIPEGAPVAWFPPRMVEFFKRQGIDKSSTRMTGEQVDGSLPGFRRLSWTIDLPKVEFVPLAIAIAGLENEDPLLEITGVSIGTGSDPQYQHSSLTVSTIVRQ